MKWLKVHRKGYTTRLGARVKATTFRIRDVGKPGRTPPSAQWYKPKVQTGWKKTQKPTYRRRLALKAHKGDIVATARSLRALSNITRDSATRKAAAADSRYFFGKLD